MKFKTILRWGLFYISCALFGALCAFFAKKLPAGTLDPFFSLWDNGLGLDRWITILLTISISFILFILAVFLQIILHEAGHLICGLISGYKFVSFRIGTFTIIKEGKKLKIKKFSIAGTGGQCLMAPPEKEDSKIACSLYNSGGVIGNLLSAILCVFLLKLQVPYPFGILLFFLTVVGIIAALLNGIPLKLNEVGNDAYNILLVRKDPIARKSIFLQLHVNALLSTGMRLKKMPEEWFELPEDGNLDNYLHAGIKFLEYYYHLDNLNFEKAKECLESLSLHLPQMIGIYQKEIKLEQIFLRILEGKSKEEIDNLFDSQLKKYTVQYSNYMINKIRILYTYSLLIEKDKENAEQLYEKAIKKGKTYPVKGEVNSEMELMDYVKTFAN